MYIKYSASRINWISIDGAEIQRSNAHFGQNAPTCSLDRVFGQNAMTPITNTSYYLDVAGTGGRVSLFVIRRCILPMPSLSKSATCV